MIVIVIIMIIVLFLYMIVMMMMIITCDAWTTFWDTWEVNSFFFNNNCYSHSELRDSSYVIRSLTTLDSPCMSSLVWHPGEKALM